MKTIEKAATDYQTKIYEDVFEESSLSEQKLQCINDFKAGVAFAQEWISVEDELPERGIVVLAKCGKTYWIADLQPHGKGLTLYSIRGSRYSEEFEATHWRPINRK